MPGRATGHVRFDSRAARPFRSPSDANNRGLRKGVAMHWYVDVLKNYVGFSGRAHRTEFWMFCLISTIISIALSVIETMIGLPGMISSLYSLAILLPALAVGMRRLHDTGRSGWWLLLWFVPVIGWIALLIFYCIDSDSGQNQYGPNPKGSMA